MNGFRRDRTARHSSVFERKSRRGKVSWSSLAAQTFVAGVVAFVVSGWSRAPLEPKAFAEPRRITPTDPDQHFKSGGRLSETVLQEILVVLKRMDERLERFEKAVERQPMNSQGPVVSSAAGDVGDPTSAVPPIQVRRNR